MKKWVMLIIVIIILLIMGGYFYLNAEKSEDSCIKAGEIKQSPAILGEIRGECCEGLTEIQEFPVPLAGEFNCDEIQPAGNDLICSACGNNVCEKIWENKCNCPEDCS